MAQFDSAMMDIVETLVWCWLSQSVEPLSSMLVEWVGSLWRVEQVILVWPLRGIYTRYIVYVRAERTRSTSALHKRHDETETDKFRVIFRSHKNIATCITQVCFFTFVVFTVIAGEYTLIHSHTHTYSLTNNNSPTQKHTHTYTHTHTHTYTHTHLLTHKLIHSYTHSYTYTHTHTHTHTYTHSFTHTQTHSLTYTLTNTHTIYRTSCLIRRITLDNKFQNIFCICDEYVINCLFASMKLEKGHKNYLALVSKLCHHYGILRNRLKYYTERCIK